MKTDAEYLADAQAAAEKSGLPHATDRGGQFIRTFIECEKAFDRAADHRARFAQQVVA